MFNNDTFMTTALTNKLQANHLPLWFPATNSSQSTLSHEDLTPDLRICSMGERLRVLGVGGKSHTWCTDSWGDCLLSSLNPPHSLSTSLSSSFALPPPSRVHPNTPIIDHQGCGSSVRGSVSLVDSLMNSQRLLIWVIYFNISLLYFTPKIEKKNLQAKLHIESTRQLVNKRTARATSEQFHSMSVKGSDI